MLRHCLAAVIFSILLPVLGCSPNTSPVSAPASVSGSVVLLLDGAGIDTKEPSFDYAVFSVTQDAGLGKITDGFSICETIGGCRSLSLSNDGRFFLVCENKGARISSYETETGRQLWTKGGEFTAAVVSPSGSIYALFNPGSIDTGELLLLDNTGEIRKREDINGFDLVFDSKHGILWVVGQSIKQCGPELDLMLILAPIKWCAVSVDVCTDGSVWVAERAHSQFYGNNRLLHISPSGDILKTIDLDISPGCLRVDQSDDSVWVTLFGHRKYLKWYHVWARTRKYDAAGNLLLSINQGGFTLDIDQTDGSIWLAGKKTFHHYSSGGRKLAEYAGVSSGQKYVAVAFYSEEDSLE